MSGEQNLFAVGGAFARDDFWRALVRRYAEGREPCNCGRAWRDAEGRCAFGCQANQLSAADEIAERVCREFDLPSEQAYWSDDERRRHAESGAALDRMKDAFFAVMGF